MNLNDYEWQNRSEEGLPLEVDGHDREWDSDLTLHDDSKAKVIYKTNEEEIDDQI